MADKDKPTTETPEPTYTQADLLAILGVLGNNPFLNLGQTSPMANAYLAQQQQALAGQSGMQVSPFNQLGMGPGGLVQRPTFPIGQLPGAAMFSPGGPNLNFTGGSPFPVNPWPTRVANTVNTVGRILQALEERKNKAKATQPTTEGGGS